MDLKMKRRDFLRNSSLAAAGLVLPPSLMAQSASNPVTSNSEKLRDLNEKPLRSIAFGSCNKIEGDMSYWSLVNSDRPDLWLWLGDNIYADHTNLTERRRRYDYMKAHPLYQQFRANTAILGTWDDHDFGYDNVGNSFWSKEESQAMFCDFMDIDHDSVVRQQDGIYQSYTFGPVGQKTQVIMLDLRYNMNKALTERQILGEVQWQWFEQQLASSTADLLIIGSSLAVTSNVTGLGLEGWHGYGRDRLRLYDALSRIDIPTVILTGDRHFSELYRVALPSGRIIHEAMSSGLTHSVAFTLPHPGRISPMIGSKSYGMLEIDWTSTGPIVKMQLKSALRSGVLAEALTRFV